LLRSWSLQLAWQLIWQTLTLQKLTIPDDEKLRRLEDARNNYLRKDWRECQLHTVDGVMLDACIKEPRDRTGPPRFIFFIGGNMQMYEFWLPYFESYARETGFGFLCFNFRGVGRSEGATTCMDDMLTDIRAGVDHLLERGVLPHHILLHGFSIGGSLAALFLASPGAPATIAITSDRSFRTFGHAAFCICRGFDAAVGREPGVPKYEEDEDYEGSTGSAVQPAWRRQLGSMGRAGFVMLRAVVAQLAVTICQATGWELNAEEAWTRIQGRKVLIYNRADNIVCYEGASLHAALSQHPQGLHDVNVVEVTLRDASDWAMHDFPLFYDVQAWREMIAAERQALGVL